MRGLATPTGEDGTAAVFVAVLTTLFLTVVSLVVDVGRLFDESAQLGHGADAAVLAVAGECARLPDHCVTAAPALVQQYAAANALDDRTAVEHVAISDDGDGDIGRVTVHTRSLTPTGGDVPLTRPRASGDTATVRAGATAAWGPVRQATTIPLALSLCDWQRALADQGSYHTSPTATGGSGTVVAHHEQHRDPLPDPPPDDDTPPPSTCVVDGSTVPTGFVELASGSACEVTSSWDGPRWLPTRPGLGLARLRDCLTTGAVVAVPLFDAVDGDAVHLAGHGALLVTGWRFPSGASDDAPTCPPHQRPPARCISGLVTRTVLAGAPVDLSGTGPTPRGVSAIQLVPTEP